ncbi:MAG: PQQ-dependent sugar dehydrogenase [Anaerolineae bacterium]
MKRFTLIVLMLCALMLTVGAQETTPEASTPEAAETTVVTTRDSMPDADAFQLVRVVNGLQYPLYVTPAGDGTNRLFIVEQSGRILISENDALLNTPFIDLSGIVSQDVLRGYSERGLLGLAFHPDYAENGTFFVNYTDRNGNTQIASYNVSADDPNVADPNSARTLLSIAQPYPNHNGGHMAFGPDGYLYVSVGDGGAADDPQNNAQTPSNLLGTILRLEVDNFDFDRPYSIPEDNPVYTNPNLAPEIWAWGLRNVWRFSFDRATGDLYMGDVGQNRYEEINFEPAGSEGGLNYGWRSYEGFDKYLRPDLSEDAVAMPITVYDHGLGCSVTGGYTYRGEAIPELEAAYLYSDYCSGRIWAAYRNAEGRWQSGVIMETNRRVSSFGEDENGELYLVDYSGEVLRFEPAQ